MTNEREFHIGDILSITTGKLVSPRRMEGVYDILRYMAGEPVWTNQIPRICREAAPVLLARHPQLAEANASGTNRDNWQQWLAAQVIHFGETLPVPRLNADQHERIDPVSELVEMVPPERIIVVES